MSMERNEPPAAEPNPHIVVRGRLDEDWSTPYYVLRRIGSVVFSLIILSIFMPIVFALGLITKWESPGPIFYRGKRVGKDGRVFTMYKLRTLKHGVESQIGVHLLQEDSNHFTRLGRFVRRTKLDEIPQFFNVIRGDMSVIGPRPTRPVRTRLFLKTIPGFRQVLQVKPGISGLSQVTADYYDPAERKFQIDLDYIQNRSLYMDFKLVVLTVVRVPIAAAKYFWNRFRTSAPSVRTTSETREHAEVHGPR